MERLGWITNCDRGEGCAQSWLEHSVAEIPTAVHCRACSRTVALVATRAELEAHDPSAPAAFPAMPPMAIGSEAFEPAPIPASGPGFSPLSGVQGSAGLAASGSATGPIPGASTGPLPGSSTGPYGPALGNGGAAQPRDTFSDPSRDAFGTIDAARGLGTDQFGPSSDGWERVRPSGPVAASSEPAGVQVDRPWVVELDSGARIPIDKPTMVIGRSRTCDVIIPSAKVSRQHATLSRVGADLFIEDLGSANGTWRGDHKVSRDRLQPGDTIRISDETLRFVQE